MSEIGQIEEVSADEIHDLKTRLSTLDPAEFDALRHANNFRWMHGILRSTGYINLFLGGLTLWLGLSGVDRSFAKVVQAAIGALIIGQSLWGLVSPTLWGVLGICITCVVCGLWNLLIAILAGFQGLSIFVALLGAFQLRWAYQYYTLYSRFPRVPYVKPTSEMTTLRERVWDGISQEVLTSKAFQEESAIFDFKQGRNWWLGWLLEDVAIFAYRTGKHVLFVRKADVSFTPSEPNNPSGENLKGRMEFGFWYGQVQMPRDSFEKYIHWKEWE